MSATIDTTDTSILREYNGYANYPTWNVMLWVDNEEWSYRSVVEFAKRQQGASDAKFTRLVANFLRRYIRETADTNASCYADIKGWANAHGKRVDWAINRIDFAELASHLREYATH